MRHGFIKVAAVSPEIKVADCAFNGDKIIEAMEDCAKKGVKIAVFPELSITGYTCGDLFFQSRLLSEAKRSLKKIMDANEKHDMFVLVGLPLEVRGKLYNVACAMKDGRLLGIIPKKNTPNYGEHYEARHFAMAPDHQERIKLGEEFEEVVFGTDILFECENMRYLKIAVEICEDLWVVIPKSNNHALAGATVLANLSASAETAGKSSIRRTLVRGQSARLMAGYIYAASGPSESTTDCVYGGHNFICEDGHILAEKKRYEHGMIVSEIDLEKLMFVRRKVNTYRIENDEDYHKVYFRLKDNRKMITFDRKIEKSPFIPENKKTRDEISEEIIMIQAMGLKKRMEHIGTKKTVIGISGGLDSTLALLSVCRAYDIMQVDRTNILAVTMPCFGTTDRTYQNALALTKELGVDFREINIKEAVTGHLRDIGHDLLKKDVTYENAQARERMQVLMDVANDTGGLVIGTGDMSEMALGWATYNGDHMSMYALNTSVPKTLVRYLVLHFAELAKEEGRRGLYEVLVDILDTPVSPELLPPDEKGVISQKTEDLVGPYELHDFFLYYMLRWGFSPDKIFRMACVAFLGDYDEKCIHKWLCTFYRRFFAFQYKRSCMPDGPMVGSLGLSPRGDLRMPSDASVSAWMQVLTEIEPK